MDAVDLSVFRRQLPSTLTTTHFENVGTRYEGKVRDSYVRNGERILIATDRLSCFDRVVTTVPFKGELLTRLARYWFDGTDDIVENHVIDQPHPNVTIARECAILPVEVVVRGYLAGSALRDYQAGRAVSGHRLDPGLSPYSALPTPIITPSTKATSGSHDLPIAEEEILAQGLVDGRIWAAAKEYALALFRRGSERVTAHGLILADTKYEFGLLEGRLILADEIHTLDSSRFWKRSTYADRVSAGQPPEMLDKEPVRIWLADRGFMGDGEIPKIDDDHRCRIGYDYMCAFEAVTGTPARLTVRNTLEEISAVLRKV